MNQSATASLMRQLNRSAILDLVRKESPIARAEIARKLNISMPTVMRVIDDLVAEDLVRWSGNSEASGGRPRSLLEFNSRGYAVVGLDLGGSKMYGTVADLGGEDSERNGGLPQPGSRRHQRRLRSPGDCAGRWGGAFR